MLRGAPGSDPLKPAWLNEEQKEACTSLEIEVQDEYDVYTENGTNFDRVKTILTWLKGKNMTLGIGPAAERIKDSENR